MTKPSDPINLFTSAKKMELGKPEKFEAFFAIISVDKDGNEGIVSTQIEDTYIPFVTPDQKVLGALIDAFVPQLKALHKDRKFKLIKYIDRVDLRDF